MPPSIYIEPVREGKIPLIVIPHGGPHGVLSDSFDHDTAYFTKLGNLFDFFFSRAVRQADMLKT